MNRLRSIIARFWSFLGAALLSAAADEQPPVRSTEGEMERLRAELEAEIQRQERRGRGC